MVRTYRDWKATNGRPTVLFEFDGLALRAPGIRAFPFSNRLSGEADVDSSAKDDKSRQSSIRVCESASSTKPIRPARAFRCSGSTKRRSHGDPRDNLPGRQGVEHDCSRATTPAGNAVLRLRGDQATFDNDWYHSVSAPPVFQVVYVGNREKPATENSGYFVEQLPLSTEEYRVEFQWRQVNSNDPWPDPNQAPLIILGEDASERDMTHLQRACHPRWIGSLDTRSVLDRCSRWVAVATAVCMVDWPNADSHHRGNREELRDARSDSVSASAFCKFIGLSFQ